MVAGLTGALLLGAPAAGPAAAKPAAPGAGKPAKKIAKAPAKRAVKPAPKRSAAPVARPFDLFQVLKVRDALTTSKEPLNTTGITVAFESGAIYLQGWVPNARQKSVAEAVAKRAAGGRPVKNQLRVRSGGR